jgi:hypothetical protein
MIMPPPPMADPLSIAAGIAGVATAGVTISMGLYDLAHKIKHAPKEVADLAQELSFLSSLLCSLRSTIRDYAHLCKTRLITDTKDILKNISRVYSDIQDLAIDSSSSFYHLKLLFKSSKTRAIMAKVEGFKSTVNLVQNTLQLAILHERKGKERQVVNTSDMGTNKLTVSPDLHGWKWKARFGNSELYFKVFSTQILTQSTKSRGKNSAPVSLILQSMKDMPTRGFPLPVPVEVLQLHLVRPLGRS